MSDKLTKRTILVTGASGKVGQAFIRRLQTDDAYRDISVRAFCHNRTLPESERLEVVRGDMAVAEDVRQAVQGVTHVLHLATCKETPQDIMDVTIKGLFWLLEECRKSPTFRQFILIGGDASVGHFFYPHPLPVTETQSHSAYPGCYALSKVLEETMLKQYFIQYDFNGCCLRAPWIMEKDDFKYTLSFGPDVFGGPRWMDLVSSDEAKSYFQTSTIPIMFDPNGAPVKRNFVQVEDLVEAILLSIDHPKARQQLFNICMDEPVDYSEVGNYLSSTRNLPTIDVPTDYHSTWLDNTKAKSLLGWRPHYDLSRLIESAWNYVRESDDPRKTWYPG
ncbi:MAG: NAD(P)-dependent oxidoreductase [Verrucomicrobia bacterium]|nr:NAD(P)-dependent oxidoreductase [Verrucomicrobiota bacterium]